MLIPLVTSRRSICRRKTTLQKLISLLIPAPSLPTPANSPLKQLISVNRETTTAATLLRARSMADMHLRVLSSEATPQPARTTVDMPHKVSPLEDIDQPDRTTETLSSQPSKDSVVLATDPIPAVTRTSAAAYLHGELLRVKRIMAFHSSFMCIISCFKYKKLKINLVIFLY